MSSHYFVELFLVGFLHQLLLFHPFDFVFNTVQINKAFQAVVGQREDEVTQ